jgi:NAD(P)-dependent dehydrogenase (short-subunit alcohol dehydrogenase family)
MSTPFFPPWPEFAGKVIAVTGGSAGIGRGIVTALAKNGAKVVVAGRNLDAARTAATAITNDFGAESLALQIDVSRPEAGETLISSAAERFGAVDGLVNNAAYFALISLLDADVAATSRMLDTNLRGALVCSQALARWTLAHKRSSAIVNVSSIAGARPAHGCGLYSASKAALNSLTKSMALEWTPLGVRVNGVAPGHVETEGVRADFEAGRLDRQAMTAAIPARRIADVADIAEAVLFLLSERSRHVVGATLTVDGGEAM